MQRFLIVLYNYNKYYEIEYILILDYIIIEIESVLFRLKTEIKIDQKINKNNSQYN